MPNNVWNQHLKLSFNWFYPQTNQFLLSGHIIECGWFLLRESERTKSKELKFLALKTFIELPLEFGEDKKQGGLFYFLDVDGLSLYLVILNIRKKWFVSFHMKILLDVELFLFGLKWLFSTCYTTLMQSCSHE